jgi:hypothetical protein
MTETSFIDLSDHDAFVEAVPHAAFAALRAEDPVHWNPEPDGPGFWAVTRYEDIRAVHRDVETFSSEIGGTSLEDLDPEQVTARKSMIDMDPPRHDELRGLIARRFTPRAVGVWEDQVRSVTREVLDTALPKGEFDFVHEIASEIPMQVFAEILGIPHEERRVIIDIGDRLLGNQDPEYKVVDDDAHRNLPFSWRRRGAPSRVTTSSPSSRSSRSPSRSSMSISSCWRRPATRRPATRSRTACSRCSSIRRRWQSCAMPATTSRCGSPPLRRCSAGQRPCTTFAAPLPWTPSLRGRRSARATR